MKCNYDHHLRSKYETGLFHKEKLKMSQKLYHERRYYPSSTGFGDASKYN